MTTRAHRPAITRQAAEAYRAWFDGQACCELEWFADWYESGRRLAERQRAMWPSLALFCRDAPAEHCREARREGRCCKVRRRE